MKCAVAMVAMASLAAYGQKIETQKADRLKITRLATTLNHLSVLEFSEPVKEVAVGSPTFKVEWRENKVFVQPLESGAATNLFIWTGSGRQSYELVPAGSVDEMHFAIDEDPITNEAKREDPPQAKATVDPPKIPSAMLMESVPVRVVGSAKSRQKVVIVLKDIYQDASRIYIRYAVANGGSRAYLPATPAVFTLRSPHAPRSLVGLANTQLGDSVGLRWKDEAPIPVTYGEMRAPVVHPGETAQGIVSFDIPPAAPPGQRTVVAFRFPEDGIYSVSAVLVL
ncbi:MAG: TrbG/VirB9 family P-type conjugative transfer protein [Bryobacterales bacterium]|nr:TrbG/VirB9 family P-type conjugative transfer protein [Bryobacterales bacterium]